MYRLMIAHVVSTICIIFMMLCPLNRVGRHIEIYLEIIVFISYIYISFFTFPRTYSFVKKVLYSLLYLLSLGVLYPFFFKLSLPFYINPNKKDIKIVYLVITCVSVFLISVFFFLIIFAEIS